jgi:DUF971 family protein
VQPSRIEIIQGELAVAWDDGSESFVPLERLRRACPCATCQGETDVMGRRLRGPPVVLTPASFEANRCEKVGGYALQVWWGDGHSTGLYTYEQLKRLGAEPA